MDLRDRSRMETKLSRVARTFSASDGEITFQYPSENILCKEFEVMQDYVGRRGEYNPCSHVKVLNFPGPIPAYHEWNWWDPFGPPSYTAVAQGDWLPYDWAPWNIEYTSRGYLGDINSVNGFIPSGDAGQFARSAYEKVLDQIPEEASIANFLLELKDVRKLIPRLNGLRTGSDLFLNWTFGWDPLIRDIKAFITLIPTVHKRLEHLKKINNRTVTISHVRTFKTIEDDSPPPNIEGRGGPYLGTSKIEYQEVKIRLNIRARYELNLQGADAFLNACMSALGLYNPTKIVWNALPWTFVIDWLINIGAVLEAAEVQPFTGTTTITGVDSTIRTKTFIGHWRPVTTPPLLVGSNMERYASSLVRGFYRRHGSPERTIITDGLTPNQQAIALALVQSNAGPRNIRWRRR